MEKMQKLNFHTGNLSRRHLSSTRVTVPFDLSRSSLGIMSNTATLSNNVNNMQEMFKHLQLQLHKQKIDLMDRAKSLKHDERCPYCSRTGPREINNYSSDKGFDTDDCISVDNKTTRPQTQGNSRPQTQGVSRPQTQGSIGFSHQTLEQWHLDQSRIKERVSSNMRNRKKSKISTMIKACIQKNYKDGYKSD